MTDGNLRLLRHELRFAKDPHFTLPVNDLHALLHRLDVAEEQVKELTQENTNLLTENEALKSKTGLP